MGNARKIYTIYLSESGMRDFGHTCAETATMHCKYASIHASIFKWKILPFQLSLSLQILL